MEKDAMRIQWYPGHMAKAKRMLIENLKLIDVVVELVDARAPAATRNPDFDKLFCNKARLVLLNKADLADTATTKAWVRHYLQQGAVAEGINASSNQARKIVSALIDRAAKPKVDAWRQKGVNKVVRCMVVGIPNVGKSTLINRLAGSSSAQVGDKPGVTKGKQWVRITPYLELMDTPGLLWPKLENAEYAQHLAFLGSINDEIMDVERLSTALLHTLLALCPQAVTARYSGVQSGMDQAELLAAVARCRGFVLRGGELDISRATRIVLDEYRGGKIARVTLELPEADGLTATEAAAKE